MKEQVKMISAKEYWKYRFDECPQTDSDKLAVAMMAEYYQEVTKNICYLGATWNNDAGCFVCDSCNEKVNYKP